MKHSIKGLFVILAIVMSFVLVQGVWARGDIETFEGPVTSADETNRTITINDVTICHMGPSWYWDLMDIPYPDPTIEPIDLIIDAFYCDILGEFVGVTVYDSDGNVLIVLRDEFTGKPLWNPKVKTTDLSDTAAEATGDGVKDYSHTYDNNWKETEEPAPHGKNDS